MPDEWSYQKAGLDLAAYAQTLANLGPHVQSTWDERVIRPPFPPRSGGKGSGGFASLYTLTPPDGRRYKKPVLVTCTDGVGSKLKIASMMRKFDTVGQDLVAMSVNDLICTGAEPLTFLDYLAMPKDDPELTTQLVKGVADGCKEAGCSLVGGETAILPDFYAPGDFDMAGFCAGVVEQKEVIDGSRIEPGDVVVGLASSGIHSNGYSLVRKVVFDAAKLTVNDPVPELGTTVGDALLTPTRLYAKPIRELLTRYPAKRGAIRGLANITGGGLIDNLPRVLPPGRRAVLRRGTWPVPPVFGWLQKLGNTAQAEMDRVFNQGIGFCVICDANYTARVVGRLATAGVSAWPIGEIIEGEPGVEFVSEVQ